MIEIILKWSICRVDDTGEATGLMSSTSFDLDEGTSQEPEALHANLLAQVSPYLAQTFLNDLLSLSMKKSEGYRDPH